MDLFISANQWMKYQGFANNMLNVYVSLAPNADFAGVSNNIKDVILDKIQDNKEYVAANPQLFLHPMNEWHLRAEWKNGNNVGGLMQFVWLFGVVGVFVLVLACINFMNLSTARSEKRAREVGIRKIMGSFRSQIVQQFFGESFILVAFAFLAALLISWLAMPLFNEMAGKQITMPWSNTPFWLASIGFITFTGLLAGSYPALYLSAFQPINVLRGFFRAGREGATPRKMLVILQFTVSVVLVIGTVVVYQQIQYAKNRSVGYTRDGLLMVRMVSPEFYGKMDVLRTELKKSSSVVEVAQSFGPVTNIWSSQGGFDWKGKDPDQQAEFATLPISPEYGRTVGWEFVDGRDFSRELASDSAGFVITESAALEMNLENAVGEIIHWEPGWRAGGNFQVLGVIKDMVMESPFGTPMPTIFYINNSGSWINVKLNQQVDTRVALREIEGVVKTVVPSNPFDYKFADQEYALKFASEERIGRLASMFATLALVISCVGLFGLASYVAEQRSKEIAIRKVVGASVISLWRLLSRDFVILVVIASVIAIPIAYYGLSTWLANYDYKVGVSVTVLVLSTLGAVVITLLTVSYQAIRAALRNPATSLTME
jgi:ABC-type antimicrobial peptide transport system permease subunit